MAIYTGDNKEFQMSLAAAMRETADLIERGQVKLLTLNISYDHVSRFIPDNGMTVSHLTGDQEVTIVLRGNPQSFRSYAEACAEQTSGEQRSIPLNKPQIGGRKPW